ncbi:MULTISPECIES: hypothetical protein [Streptomyces]|uniref:PH domain-containing protein n=1 Tax=Streptomyces ramulosus TaxID=47762 RepID=A0ABW1FKQ2_9ACTN
MATSETHAQKWIDALAVAGMNVPLRKPVACTPSALSGLHAVNGIDTEPTVKIPKCAPTPFHSLDIHWKRQTDRLDLYSEKGEALVCSPFFCLEDVAWLRFQDPLSGEGLPSRLMRAKASPEFLALSLDGKRLCAISVEDDEYWIVTHSS